MPRKYAPPQMLYVCQWPLEGPGMCSCPPHLFSHVTVSSHSYTTYLPTGSAAPADQLECTTSNQGTIHTYMTASLIFTFTVTTDTHKHIHQCRSVCSQSFMCEASVPQHSTLCEHMHTRPSQLARVDRLLVHISHFGHSRVSRVYQPIANSLIVLLCQTMALGTIVVYYYSIHSIYLLITVFMAYEQL